MKMNREQQLNEIARMLESDMMLDKDIFNTFNYVSNTYMKAVKNYKKGNRFWEEPDLNMEKHNIENVCKQQDDYDYETFFGHDEQ